VSLLENQLPENHVVQVAYQGMADLPLWIDYS